MVTPLALASSTARRTPFSVSLPRCACAPVKGAELPIFTTSSCALATPNASMDRATIVFFKIHLREDTPLCQGTTRERAEGATTTVQGKNPYLARMLQNI